MKGFSKWVMTESISGDAVHIINSGWETRDAGCIDILADWLDDRDQTQITTPLRQFLSNRDFHSFQNVVHVALPGFVERSVWLGQDGMSFFFWESDSIPPRAISFASRGPERYWLGCRTGTDPQCCLFGAQWNRPGNMYDTRRRRRPASWMICGPNWVFGHLDDPNIHADANTHVGEIMPEILPLVANQSALSQWNEGHNVKPNWQEKMFCMLVSKLRG